MSTVNTPNHSGLYTIVKDPQERDSLVEKENKIFKDMLERYNKFSKEPREMQDQGYHSQLEVPNDENACHYMVQHGGYWRPWKNM